MKQEVIDRRYLMIAKIWSENSYAIRRKVGAIIVKDNRLSAMATTARRQALKTFAKR